MRRLALLGIAWVLMGQAVGVGVGPSFHRRGKGGGSSFVFDLDPSRAATGAGVAALPAQITINGTTLTPDFRYYGADADGTDWDAGGYGETLTAQGSGGSFDQDVPTLNASDGAVVYDGTQYYQDTTKQLDVGTDDFVLEVVTTMSDGSSEPIFTSRDTSVQLDTGISMVCATNERASLYITDGTSSVFNVTATSAVPHDTYHHFLFVGDRSGNLLGYKNGALYGTKDISGLGSVVSGNPLTVGAIPSGSKIPTTAATALISGYTCDGCLDNSDTTEEDALALERFSRIAGTFPRLARGDSTPTTVSRSSTATLQKCTGGTCTLFDVGDNWPRVVRTNDDTGYLPEPSRENLALQSEDFTTSWTEIDAGDTQDADGATAPDGSSTADGNIADATDGEHGFSQAITVTAATHAFGVFAQAGDQNWLFIEDSTVSNATLYADLSDCSLGTAGGGTIDTFIDDYGGNWCFVAFTFTGTAASHTFRVLSAEADGDKSFAGDASTVNTYFWGAQVEAGAYPSSYIATTTASVTRSADEVSGDDEGNYSASQGSIVCDVWLPDYDLGSRLSLLSVTDGTATNQLDIGIEASGDAVDINGRSSGGTDGDVTGTTDVTDGAEHTIAVSYQSGRLALYVDGTEEGAADTSFDPPTSLTQISFGHLNGANELGGIIPQCRLYARPGVQQ